MRQPIPHSLRSLALAASAACAQAQTPAAGLDCMIQPHLVVQVGTASPGVIQSVRVDRGDLVKRGQPLVLLQADVERAALAVARERASQSGELVATRGAQDLAEREAQRAAQLVDENFVSRTYFDRQRAEVQVATGRGEQAQERVRLARREVELASAQLNQRTVVSPIDGVVVERFVSPGEYVEQKPVLRIAALDPLRVDVLVPAAQFGRVALGAKASVVPELLDRRTHAATVTSVDRVVDAASNTFRVRLELPNPGGVLPPGLRCKAELVMMAGGEALRRAGAATAAAPTTTPATSPATTPATSPAPPPAAPATPASAPPVAVAPSPRATVADVRRTEPVEPAVGAVPALPTAQASVRTKPGAVLARRAVPTALAMQVQARRAEPVEPAQTLLAAAPVAAPARPEPQTPAPSQAPGRLRLKMAPIDWPTDVAVLTPKP